MSASDSGHLLARWEAGGGSWRVIVRTASRVTVELLSCDGQSMELVELSDPASIEGLGQRLSNEDDGVEKVEDEEQ